MQLSLQNIYAFEQNKVAKNETQSPDYKVFNLIANATTHIKKQKIIFNFSCTNIFNEIYSDHLSTLKDTGFYEQGRSINFGVKFLFESRKKM
jgi:outer membrane receptor protein involved in Fe transport